MFDLVVLQLDVLVLIVLADVLLAFGLVLAHSLGPPAGFLLDFQPGVDVVLEEALTGFWEMPHLADVLDLVAQLDGFLQFGGAPRTGQGALVFGVCAQVGSLQGRFLHFFLHAGGTEWKGEFASLMVRQHGMVQLRWRHHSTFDKTKVTIDVGVTRLRDELGMTFGVDARLVDPGVQGGVIDVVDLLARCHVMVQLGGIGASSTKGVTRVEGFHKFKGVHVRLDVGRGLLEVGPLTFPHFNDIVALGTKTVHFVLGVLVNRMHGTLAKAEMFFVTYGIALGTTVPETPVEFVHGVGLAMETVDGEGGARYVILAGIADVLNVMALNRIQMVWVSAGHLVVSFQVFVGELLQGLLAQFVITPG